MDNLEIINQQELERNSRALTLIKDSQNNFIKAIKGITEEFKVKLANNTETLLYLFDIMFIYEDFSYIAGDEVPETKRSNIKNLLTKKKNSKPTDVYDPRGKKKIWPGINAANLNLLGDCSSELPQLQSYKGDGQKCVVMIDFSHFYQIFTLMIILWTPSQCLFIFLSHCL